MFSKTTERTACRVNRSVNYGLWVIMMCPWGFSNFNKCSTPAWAVVVREAMGVQGSRCMGTCYFLLNFVLNLKLHKKVIFFFF